MSAEMIAALEASLAVSWDPAQLGVLADALLADGDPRGELIALDLYADVHGPAHERAARKRELQIAWLGELGTHSTVGVDHGFLTLSIVDDNDLLAHVLAHPQARTLRALSIFGHSAQLAIHFGHVIGRTWPWLRRLEVVRLDMAWRAALDGATSKQVAASAPALEELAVRGHHPFGVFPHPNVRRISIDNYYAFGSRGLSTDFSMPLLREARLSPGPGPWHEYNLSDVFHVDAVPKLTHLDVSAPPRVSVANLLEGLHKSAIKRQLTHLWLPALTTDYELDILQRALAQMPHLVELHVGKPLPGAIDHACHVIVSSGRRAGP